jgi:hypothetical protein
MSFILVLTEILQRDLNEKELELRYKRGRLDSCNAVPIPLLGLVTTPAEVKIIVK